MSDIARSSFVTNAGSLAVRMRRRADSFVALQRGAMKKSVDELKQEAIAMSSKQYASTNQLRKMGHPYASARFAKRLRARSSLPAPSFIINRQTGEFVGSWRAFVRLGANGLTGTVYNVSSHARHMQGTVKMIRRPILDEAMRRRKARLINNFKGAMHNVNEAR